MRYAVALLLAASCRREVPVLLYHEVGCGTHDVRDVPADEFDHQLSWLEGHGFRFVTAAEALRSAARGREVAVTFDDGAACVYSAAFPILRSHRAPFELFLVSDWISSDPGSRHLQPLEDGEQVATLAWPEVKAMAASGLAQVGAHGRNHLYLRRLGDAALTSEVAGSRQDLAAVLGTPVDLFAYPFGAFNEAVLEAVRLSGFTGAYSVGVGVGGAFAYRRRSVHRGLSDAAFERLLADRWILPLVNHD
ncbi:MAG: polysaccharide deacetylase family protein [Myxococcales bacterium]